MISEDGARFTGVGCFWRAMSSEDGGEEKLDECSINYKNASRCILHCM